MTGAADVIYLADHSVVLALPALVPALVIVGVVLFVVARDRRAERSEAEAAQGNSSEDDATTHEETQ